MAPATTQVAIPFMSKVEGLQLTVLGPVTTQVSVPDGVPPGPVTVAVNVKVPPVTTKAALSVTVVVEEVVPAEPAGGESRPSETTQVMAPMKATSQLLIPLTPV
jgi:hypothetical protein